MQLKSASQKNATILENGTNGVWMLQPIFIDERNVHIIILDFQGFNFSRHADDKSAMSSQYHGNVDKAKKTD